MTDHTVDAVAFGRFEKAGWERAAAAYHDAVGDVTQQSIPALLDAVAAAPGVRLLDAATGPGYVAGAAAARGASAVGLDVADAMLDRARRAFPRVEFLAGDAQALPFADGAFDAVTIAFGLMHLARPELAVAEAHRVLRPGGRFGFAVWAPPDRALGIGIPLQAIQTHGRTDVPLPPGPPVYRYGDHAAARGVLEDAGFAGVEVVEVPQTWRLPSGAALLPAIRDATVRTAALLAAQDPGALDAIQRAAVEAAEAYRDGDAVALPMPAVVACGVKASG
ncbi:MAG TPA: methyltransferase domain-containing protein [Chloroflexota bacterium]|nr:methyltransferase domain-containing protein [Chloroflexota bacterium]